MNSLAEILDAFDPISYPYNTTLAHSASATNAANQEETTTNHTLSVPCIAVHSYSAWERRA